MRTDVEELFRRADSLYSTKEQPQHPAVYVVEPPPAAKPTELDEARGLVLAFLRELPDLALTLAAMLVILARHAWRWLRRRVAKPHWATSH
jgi:hypothetical protein